MERITDESYRARGDLYHASRNSLNVAIAAVYEQAKKERGK